MTATATSFHVKVGGLHVLAKQGLLYSIGLGSCVAVALYDAREKIGGLAHVMLPVAGQPNAEAPGRFAPAAVPALVERMVSVGAHPRSLYARIAGGAAMFRAVLPVEGAALGDRNVTAVKAALAKAGIPLRGEDVGGAFGRSVYFDADDGSVLIRAVRRGDLVL